MPGIYKIENNINHKIYIGLTNNFERRWMEHKRRYLDIFSSSYNCKLYRAFRRYGLHNFTFSILEECSSDILGEREQYWINYYNSFYSGYNMTLGGEGWGRKNFKKVYQYDKQGFFLKDFNSCLEASIEVKVSQESIKECCRGNRFSSAGFQWSYNKVDNLNNIIIEGTPVVQFSLSGERIKLFSSIKNAAEELNLYPGQISKSCRLKKNCRAGDFLWRYLKDVEGKQRIEKYVNPCSKKLYQYNLEGKYLQEYDSISNAAEDLNLSVSNLTTCCQRKQKTVGGFQWSYEKKDFLTPAINERNQNHIWSSNKRKINQYSKNGDFIATFESAHEAARANNIKSSSHITECCNGKRKTCSGYIWKYTEES